MQTFDTNSEIFVRKRKNIKHLVKNELNYTTNDDNWIQKKSKTEVLKGFIYFYVTLSLNAIRSVVHRLTGRRSVDPTKQILNNLLQKFSFDVSQTLSAEELFAQKLESNDLESALDLAKSYGFDSDIVYQRMWRNTGISEQSIDQFLSKISKQLWVLRECVECVAQDLDSMKYLLQFGLNITNWDNFKTHFYSRTNSEDKAEDQTDEDIEEVDNDLDLNSMSLESKQVLIWRKRLFLYLDRLVVYQMIFSYREINNKYNQKFYQLFREMSSFEAILHFARNSDYNAVSLLLTYEPNHILEHRLVILSNIDETLSPVKYSSLLPKVVSPKVKGQEVYDWNQIKLRDEDWVETQFASVCALDSSQYETDFYTENTNVLKYKTNRLTKSLLTEWYSQRSREILSKTSIVSNALDLITIGIKHMVPNLDKLYTDLDVFSLIVYERDSEEDIDFEEFENYSNNRKMDLLMTGSLESEEQFLNFMEKFLKVFISKVCKDDKNLLQTIGRDLFREYLVSVAKYNLDFCLKVFENSSLSDIEVEKLNKKALIEDPSDLIEFAIDCIYASEDSTQLETAFKIMECLPQREMVAIIANNDINQINRLNQLNDLADKLENYLVVAEIIEQYGCPPTVSQLRDLEKTGDREGVKHLFIKVTRSCVKRQKPLTVNEWIDVFKNLEEVRKMCFNDCITEDQLFEIFVQTLLCSARKENFGLAAGYMQLDSNTKYKKKVIPFLKSKKLILSAAQEYINSADSVHDCNIMAAKECLQLIDEKECQKDVLIAEELDLIECLYLIEDNFHIKLLPIQIRLIPQPRLELIEKLLNSLPKAYTKTSKILKISELFKVCSDFDIDYRNGIVLSMIANKAFNSNDFKHCFNSCELIMKNNYRIGWKVCLDLGFNKNYQNIENRLKVLCFALTYCHIHYEDEETKDKDIDILDIINAIKQLKSSQNIKLAKI